MHSRQGQEKPDTATLVYWPHLASFKSSCFEEALLAKHSYPHRPYCLARNFLLVYTILVRLIHSRFTYCTTLVGTARLSPIAVLELGDAALPWSR